MASLPVDPESCDLRRCEFGRRPFERNCANVDRLLHQFSSEYRGAMMALWKGNSDSDEEFSLLEQSPLMMYRRARQYRRRREGWVNHIYAKRNEFGEFAHLWHDLQVDNDYHFS